jgi:hypothetical protein
MLLKIAPIAISDIGSEGVAYVEAGLRKEAASPLGSD